MCVLIVGQAFAASWRMHRASPDRTGRALEEASPPLTQAWLAYTAGPVFGSPVVAGDKILVATEQGDVVAFSESGAELWRTGLGAPIRATPVVRADRVYVPATNGRLSCLGLADGRIVYQVAVGGGTDGASPALTDDLLIGGGAYPDTSLYAVTIASGGVRWRTPVGAPVYASPAIGPNYLIAASGNGRVYRLGLDGRVVWTSTAPTGAMYYVAPLIANGLAYVSGGGYDRTVRAYDLGTGLVRWIYTMVGSGDEVGPNHPSSVSSDGTRVFVVGGLHTTVWDLALKRYVPEQRLYALDAQTGTGLWHVSVGSATGLGFAGSPAVAQDVVYAVGGNTLWAFTASTGGALGSWPLEGQAIASPAVANGRVYVGTLGGYLHAFDAALAVALRSPDHELIIRGRAQVPVTAVILGHTPVSVSVEYAPGRKPPEEGGFTQILTAPLSTGTAAPLGTWSTPALPPGDHTVRLTVTDTNGRVARALAYVQGSIELARKKIIAAAGGTVTAPDGTFVRFEPGGLAGDTEVIINQGNKASDGATIGATEREILLNPVVTLTKRATLSLPYLAADAEGKRRDYFRVYWNVSGNAWQPINTSLSKTAENRVEAEVTHFSLFRVQQYAPREKLLYPDEVYTYPNPARSVGKLTFKFLLGDQADVTIKVFNVAGEQVGELGGTYDTSAAGKTQSLDWNLGGVASGVYYYRIEAKNATRSDAVTKKLAVIQ